MSRQAARQEAILYVVTVDLLLVAFVVFAGMIVSSLLAVL